MNVLGEEAEYVWHTEAEKLESYDAVIIPGGASYGDYLRPGALAKGSKAIEQFKSICDIRKTSFRRWEWISNSYGSTYFTRVHFFKIKVLKFRSGKAKLTVQNADSLFTSEYEKGQEITIPFAHQYGNYYVDEKTVT